MNDACGAANRTLIELYVRQLPEKTCVVRLAAPFARAMLRIERVRLHAGSLTFPWYRQELKILKGKQFA